jgi:hypothetical protein
MRVENNDRKEVFAFYKNWEDFYESAKQALANANQNFKSVKKIKRRLPDEVGGEVWIGSTSREELEAPITKFIFPEELSQAIDDIKELFSTISLGGAFDKDRLIATDRPIGVFDFSLASSGLYRPQEYYDPEKDELISPDLVTKVGGDFFYYEVVDAIESAIKVIQQQSGTYALKERDEYKESLQKEGVSEERAKVLAKKKYPKAKLIFRTRNKKVYVVDRNALLSPEQRGKEKYVDIFIPIGGTVKQTPTTLLYSTMPSLLLAYFLDGAGIKTRISGIPDGVQRGALDLREKYRFMEAFLIKGYDDGFDFNKIAILTADSRIFRWKIFKNIAGKFDKYFNYDVGGSLGTEAQGADLNKMFERYKNWYVKQNENGEMIFNRNKNLMLISKVVFAGDETRDEMMKDVKREFFRLVDAIDMEFNGMERALPRIAARNDLMGIDRRSLFQRVKGSIALATMYDSSDSVNSNTDEEIATAKALKTTLENDAERILL